MRAISPDTRKAAPPSQASGRPRVLNIVEDERDTPIMHDASDIRIPAQRQPEPTCPLFCTELHLDELPGERSHYGASHTVHLPDGAVLVVDVHADDGRPAGIVLHDSDGNTRHVPTEQAEQYALAILVQVALARGLTPPATALTELAGTVTR
jgi:hypothetical protein